jgi:transcriptional regulator with XRE-family HTH domain
MARPYKNSSQHAELIEFGKAVRSTRLEMGISQESLAELADIDRSYMGGVERGEHNLALINMKRIAKALEVPISLIMKKADL